MSADDRIGPGVDGGLGVLEAGDAADLDSDTHGEGKGSLNR